MGLLPYVYVTGGYQSPSIILTDTRPTPGFPNGRTIPLGEELEPLIDYEFSVILNLRPEFYLESYFGSITVLFWTFEGGVGLTGLSLDIQQVDDFFDFSGMLTLEVKSARPFKAADVGGHKCAVVSIENLILTDLSGNKIPIPRCPRARVFSLVPDPTLDPAESCSAWRNTGSQSAHPRKPWHFKVGFGKFNPEIKSTYVELEIQTHYVPVAWNKNDKVVETEKLFRAAGVQSKVPYYLLPGLKDSLEQVDLQIKIDEAKDLHSEQGKTNFLIDYKKDHSNSFQVSGTLPKQAQQGDIVLVNVIANYKDSESKTIGSREFLEILRVVDK